MTRLITSLKRGSRECAIFVANKVIKQLIVGKEKKTNRKDPIIGKTDPIIGKTVIMEM